MSRSAHPTYFPTFVPDNNLKRKGAAFSNRLLSQHFRKEEDGLPPRLGVRRRRALEGHLGIHPAYDEIIGRHGAYYVQEAKRVASGRYRTQEFLERAPVDQAWNLENRRRVSPGMIVKMPRAPEARKAALAYLLAASVTHMRLFQAVEAFRSWLVENRLSPVQQH